TFIEVDGIVQPAPAPRFSRTPGAVRSNPAGIGERGAAALKDWGFEDAAVAGMASAGLIKAEG
ncbi:hypothetical protein ACSTIP_00075, partial [Vibrio parahaemolyticus]